MARRQRPRANTLVAAATLLSRSGGDDPRDGLAAVEDWQNRAWDAYRTVGEARFAVTWLANALSRVNLIAARLPDAEGDEPRPIEADDTAGQAAVTAVRQIAGGQAGQGQLLASLAVHLSVPGVGYVHAADDPKTEGFSAWNVLSQDEIRPKKNPDGTLDYERRYSDKEWRIIPPADHVIKCWRQDPQHSYLPDSPFRAVLDTLDEIKVLSASIRATAESRLSGPGILVLPLEAVFPKPPPPASGTPESDDIEEGDVVDDAGLNDFHVLLTQVMMTPKQDPGAAAAKVPIVIQVPGEYVDKVTRITFDSPLDAHVVEQRDAAIRRFALGVEVPPEILTGVGDVNHWSAWAVQESAVTLSVEPLAELICHALTEGYLSVVLSEQGVDASQFVVWYDTSELRTRPDLSAAAAAAYDRMELSGTAFRRETGLSEDDAPDPAEVEQRILWKLLDNPALAPTVAAMLVSKLSGVPLPAEAPSSNGDAAPVEDPATDGPPAREDALAAACDGLVHRALERAGSRLRSAAGRRIEGGAAAVQCDDVAKLHTVLDATKCATLDDLLAGAWERVPLVAARYGADTDDLTAALDTYTRALIATGHAHDYDRLVDAIGVHAASR